MGKAQTVKIGPHENYEAEVLTGITESSYVEFAIGALLDFADSKFSPVQEGESKRFRPQSLKDKKEFALFNTIFNRIAAVLASDKNNVIDSVAELFELARSDKEAFDKLYQAAIAANPTLDKESEPDQKN